MSEEVDPNATPEDPEDAELASLAVDDGKGSKMVPLSALIGAKREGRASAKRVKELEPVAARVTEIDAKLGAAQPIIDAILTNPKLRAEAIKMAGGTRSTADTTDQPDDPDAVAIAEEFGLYLSDGVTPDAARGLRVLGRLDARHGRQTDDRIRPLAGVTLGQKAEANLRDAAAQTDDDGTPIATAESIREVASQLPPNLLADPKVVDLVLNLACGIDHRKGRTPKAVDEPIYLASAGSGRTRERKPSIDAGTRTLMERLGVSETEFNAAGERLAGGRG